MAANDKDSVKSVDKISGSISDYFTKLFEEIDKVLMTDVEKYYNLVMGETLPLLGAILLCWIVWQAYNAFFGQADLSKAMRTGTKFIVIYILLGSWGYVYPYIADPLINGIPELVEGMSGTKGDTLVTAFAQQIFTNVATGLGSIGAGGIGELAMAIPIALTYVLVMVLGVLIMALYFIIFVQCKLIIALLVITAPIFLGCAIFESTRDFFNNWVATLFAQFLILLLLTITTLLIIGVVTNLYAQVWPSGTSSLNSAGGLLVGELIALITMSRVPGIAAELANKGFSVTGGQIGGLTSMAVRAARGGK